MLVEAWTRLHKRMNGGTEPGLRRAGSRATTMPIRFEPARDRSRRQGRSSLARRGPARGRPRSWVAPLADIPGARLHAVAVPGPAEMISCAYLSPGQLAAGRDAVMGEPCDLAAQGGSRNQVRVSKSSASYAMSCRPTAGPCGLCGPTPTAEVNLTSGRTLADLRFHCYRQWLYTA